MSSNDGTPKSTATPVRGVVTSTIFIAGLANASLAAGRLMVPILALALGASIELVGVTAALFTVVPLLFSIQFGRWVDRTGTLAPIAFSALLIALGAAAALVFQSKYSLLLTATLVGAGAIFTHIVATKAVGEAGPREHRGRNLGLLVMFYSITQFIGPTIGGAAYERFGIAAALAVICIPALMMLASLGVTRHNFRPHAGGSANDQTKLRISELTTMPALRKWLIVSAIFMSVITIFPVIVALHALEVGISPTNAGLVLGACSGGMFVARIIAPVAGKRMKPERLVQISLLLGGCAYAMLPFTGQFYTFAASGALVGLTLGMGGPLTLLLIYEAAPSARINEAVGLSLAMTSFLQIMLPLMMGFTAARVGLTPAVFALAVGVAGASLYALRSRNA